MMKMSGQIHSGVEDVKSVEPSTTSSFTTIPVQTSKHTQLVCELCNVKATSYKILQKHLEGRKHIMRVQRNGKTFNCDLCQVIANSQNQLEIHFRSSRHKARVARKERMEFMSLSYSKGTWILLFGMLCVFLNLLLFFKMIL